ncbi:hypothetical protein HDU96_010537 [Phlyctochytrium bullatum]|nr:hypothetical protein HDU96_010537 [Phlyctochytrium bullatum]
MKPSLAFLAIASGFAGLAEASYWQPKVGTSWQLQLTGTLKYDVPAVVFHSDIDSGFEPAKVHALGKKAICYINAGALETFRSDYASFPAEAKGNAYPGWDEVFIDIRHSKVRSLIAARFQRAAEAGCDAVEPDNMDSYMYNNGFKLTETDAKDYFLFLSNEAHSRGMAIGLKNCGDMLANAQYGAQVLAAADFSVVESCYPHNSCGQYEGFIKGGKPVFAVEYPDTGSNGGCADTVPADKVEEAKAAMLKANMEGYLKDCAVKSSEYNPVQTYNADGYRTVDSSIPNPPAQAPATSSSTTTVVEVVTSQSPASSTTVVEVVTSQSAASLTTAVDAATLSTSSSSTAPTTVPPPPPIPSSATPSSAAASSAVTTASPVQSSPVSLVGGKDTLSSTPVATSTRRRCKPKTTKAGVSPTPAYGA